MKRLKCFSVCFVCLFLVASFATITRSGQTIVLEPSASHNEVSETGLYVQSKSPYVFILGLQFLSSTSGAAFGTEAFASLSLLASLLIYEQMFHEAEQTPVVCLAITVPGGGGRTGETSLGVSSECAEDNCRPPVLKRMVTNTYWGCGGGGDYPTHPVHTHNHQFCSACMKQVCKHCHCDVCNFAERLKIYGSELLEETYVQWTGGGFGQNVIVVGLGVTPNQDTFRRKFIPDDGAFISSAAPTTPIARSFNFLDSFQNEYFDRIVSIIRSKLEENSIEKLKKKHPELGHFRSGVRILHFLIFFLDGDTERSYTRWDDRARGQFTLIQAEFVAEAWRQIKQPNMPRLSRDSFERSLRYYYGKGIKKVGNRRSCSFQFVANVQINCLLWPESTEHSGVDGECTVGAGGSDDSGEDD